MNIENSLYPHGVGRLVVRFLCDGAVEGCVADFLTWVFLWSTAAVATAKQG